MLTLDCAACDKPVLVENMHIGPIAGAALLPPLEAIHPACVERRDLAAPDDGGFRAAELEGRLFLEILPGAFLRSNHERTAHVFRRRQRG